jgi:hypothetical protein
MARQIRRKSKAKTARAKTKVKARARTTKARPRAAKKAAKRKTARRARPKAKTGIVAAVTGAFQTVADTFKETALLRNKMEPPGKSETG